MSETTEKPRLEKINRAAKAVGISGKFVREMIRDGRIVGYALSEKIVLVDPLELREVIEACRMPTTATE